MIKVLVAYASKHGATADIAAKIGETLHHKGLQADVLSIADVSTLAPYQAVILGSGVYAGQWLKEASSFLVRNEQALVQIPTWIFSSGPTGEGDPLKLVKGWRLPETLLEHVEHIHPRDVVVFHGEIDTSELNFGEKLIVKGVRAPVGDFRDWAAITQWAFGVAETLLNEPLPNQMT